MEAMRNYKSLASYSMLQSGWVQAVEHYRPDGSELTIFRTEVIPSFRVNDTPHKPWAAITDQGDISTAHCDCKAG